MRATPGCITWGRVDGRLVPIAVRAVNGAPPAPRRLTEDEKKDAVRRHSAGDTFAQIAAALGTSRSAIAGVIFRARQSGQQIDRQIIRISPAPRAPRPTPVVKPAQTADHDGYRPASVSFIELGPGHCRWPLWETNADPSAKLYCGNAVLPGQSYCKHCHGLSYSTSFTRDIDRKLNLKSFVRRVA